MSSLVRLFLQDGRHVSDFARSGNSLSLCLGMLAGVIIASLLALDVSTQPGEEVLDLHDLYVTCTVNSSVPYSVYRKLEPLCKREFIRLLQQGATSSGDADLYVNDSGGKLAGTSRRKMTQEDILLPVQRVLVVSKETATWCLISEMALTVTLYMTTRWLIRRFSTPDGNTDMNSTFLLGAYYSALQVCACAAWSVLLAVCCGVSVQPAASLTTEEERTFQCYTERHKLYCSYTDSSIKDALGQLTRFLWMFPTFLSHNAMMSGNIFLCVMMVTLNVFLLILFLHALFVEYVCWVFFYRLSKSLGFWKTKIG